MQLLCSAEYIARGKELHDPAPADGIDRRGQRWGVSTGGQATPRASFAGQRKMGDRWRGYRGRESLRTDYALTATEETPISVQRETPLEIEFTHGNREGKRRRPEGANAAPISDVRRVSEVSGGSD